MATDTMTFSNFLRDSGTAVKSAEKGDVKLERRDGDDLVMRLAWRDASEREGMKMTVSLLTAMISKVVDKGDVFAEAFPWTTYLPEQDQQAFVQELQKTIRASNDLNRPDLIDVLVSQWKNTAEVWADPELRRKLNTPLDLEGEVIPKPA